MNAPPFWLGVPSSAETRSIARMSPFCCARPLPFLSYRSRLPSPVMSGLPRWLKSNESFGKGQHTILVNKRGNGSLGSVWAAAAEVECMNCSVLSFDSFMFCGVFVSTTKVRRESRAVTYLSSNLQHVLECHTCRSQLTLEQHNDIVIVFINLFSFRSLG